MTGRGIPVRPAASARRLTCLNSAGRAVAGEGGRDPSFWEEGPGHPGAAGQAEHPGAVGPVALRCADRPGHLTPLTAGGGLPARRVYCHHLTAWMSCALRPTMLQRCLLAPLPLWQPAGTGGALTYARKSARPTHNAAPTLPPPAPHRRLARSLAAKASSVRMCEHEP